MFELDGPLWRFAVRLYGRDGVSSACIRLQDEGGADVLLLIAGLYADVALARPLSREDVVRLGSTIAAWRDEAIAPLRAVRRWLKPSHPAVPDEVKDGLRNRVKALELEAERIQLAIVAQWLDERPYAGAGEPLQLSWLVADKAQVAALADAFALVFEEARTL